MPVALTEKAAAEVRRVKDEQQLEEEVFLRVGAAAGGCSGFSYRLEFDKSFDSKQDDEYESLAEEAGAAAFYPKRHLDVEVVRDLIEMRHQQVLAA